MTDPALRRRKSKLILHDGVTLTDRTFQHIAIGNVKMSAAIFNGMHRLQDARRDSDARTPCAQPAGDHFLREF